MEKLKLHNVRLSFPALFKKAVFNGEETKYEATFLIPKGSSLAKEAQAALEQYIHDEFQDKPPKGLKRTCITDGDEKEYDGYEGMLALKASTKKRPLVIDSDKTPVLEEDNRIYAGCYVNAIVSFWYSNHELGGKQILANLGGVQFFKDGEPFTEGGASVDDFDDFSEEF